MAQTASSLFPQLILVVEDVVDLLRLQLLLRRSLQHFRIVRGVLLLLRSCALEDSMRDRATAMPRSWAQMSPVLASLSKTLPADRIEQSFVCERDTFF